MHIRIIQKRTRPGSLKEVQRLAKKLERPNIKNIPGFVAYYVLDTGEDQWATVAIFKDASGVDRWTKECARVFKDSEITKHLLSRPHDQFVLSGDVKHSEVAK
jgi:heme-degrading monooxygenase HmoA